MQSHATSPAELVKFVLLKAAGAQRAEAADSSLVQPEDSPQTARS